MKRNLFLSFFLFSGIGLIAQEIDISKFVLPEYKRSALEFNFSSSNSGNLSKTKEDTGSISYKSQSVSTGNSGYVNFSRISNNLKYQGNISTSLELGIPSLSKSWNKHTMVELENSTRRYSFGFDFTSANRFYSSKKKYFEIDPTIVINNSSYRHFSEAFYTDPASNYNNLIKNSDLNLNLESDFRVGVGRVEPVEDMRQVLYILEDLKTAGRLKRELSQEETIQLAEKLAVLKNKRFLDSRLRLIEETIEIEKILSEMDLITEYDALFFATVNDYWSMAPNPGRSSGKRISLGVKPSYNSSQYKNYTELQEFSPDTITSDEYLNLENGFRVNFSAFYENYKPLDLYWQRDFNVALYSGFRNLNTDFESPLISTKADILVSGLISNYYLNYYPNSRTSYSGNAGIIYEFGNGTEESVVEDTKYRNLRTYVSLSSTYYFSPQLTLNGSAGFSYNHLNNNSSFYSIATYPIQNSGNLYLSFSLKYKMF